MKLLVATHRRAIWTALYALFVMVAFGWMGVPANAAEIRCVSYYSASQLNNPPPEWDPHKFWPSGRRPAIDRSCFEGLLVGQIVKGDYLKSVSFYRANHPFLSQFRLNSPGGDADEAINIGRLFRKYLITAWAPIGIPRSPHFYGKYARGKVALARADAR